MISLRWFLAVLCLRVALVILIAAAGLSCATKRFIRGQVGEVNQRVDVLSGTTEETAGRIRSNEERIGQLDAKATSAQLSAAEARLAADAAQASVTQARSALARLEEQLASSQDPRPPVILPRPLPPSTGPGVSPGPSSELIAPAFGAALGALETYRDQLVAGQAGISGPEKMIVGQSGDVVLLVSLKQAAEELKGALERLAGAGSVRVIEATRLSKSMKAKLTGSDFDITAVSSEEQTGILEDDVSWKWEVRPRKPGTLRLTATLTAVLRVDGQDRTRDEKQFSKVILVEAAPPAPRAWRDTASDLWSAYKPPAGFVYGTLLTGAVTWLWGRWTKRRGADKDDNTATSFE